MVCTCLLSRNDGQKNQVKINYSRFCPFNEMKKANYFSDLHV